MKTIKITNRETGTLIEEVNSIEEAKATIAKYEEEDKQNGDFAEDFYQIEEN